MRNRDGGRTVDGCTGPCYSVKSLKGTRVLLASCVVVAEYGDGLFTFGSLYCAVPKPPVDWSERLRSRLRFEIR